jgi:hypothetical protein
MAIRMVTANYNTPYDLILEVHDAVTEVIPQSHLAVVACRARSALSALENFLYKKDVWVITGTFST